MPMLKISFQIFNIIGSPLKRVCRSLNLKGNKKTRILFCDNLYSLPSGLRKTHHMASPSPKLIVFDLDYTLWPFWVDTNVDPPFNMKQNGKVYDCRGQRVEYFPDVPDILAKLRSQGYKLAIASRTSAQQEAEELVRLFKWDDFFDYRQIYPGCKITHFKKIQGSSGIPFQDMLFFDDEHRNIVDVSTLGVTCMFVPDNGVSHESLKEGFDLFRENNSKPAPPSSS